jgi:arginine repressor
MAEIVGTTCGDDTLFVATRSGPDATALAAKFEAAMMGHALS